MKVWNGTAFVDPTAFKVWNGTAFVNPELYTWNGTSFDKVWPTFEPFSISSEDPGYEDLIDEPVPEGASGCWVTLVGGGGGGGAGYQSFDDTYRRGGGGGAGGAKIPRVWVPREAMGSSYSVVLGLGGAYTGGGSTGFGGTDGGSSSFLSGSVSLIAGGGARGAVALSGSSTQVSGGAGSLTSVVSGVAGAVVIPGAPGGKGARRQALRKMAEITRAVQVRAAAEAAGFRTLIARLPGAEEVTPRSVPEGRGAVPGPTGPAQPTKPAVTQALEEAVAVATTAGPQPPVTAVTEVNTAEVVAEVAVIGLMLIATAERAVTATS
ncbi:minor tail protein [Mycobacterium phage PopTart]|uniref:Minor tail protein n=1 Tax=Mycobacterium phage PopTart TaxID=1698712 RepID=A0A0K2FMX9_9CAUD|nr:minor tail protein [Mycobacterium phage PopTart]ALA48572.1 minor tail protein [Mycobacterium phage PopTart]AQY55531.1 minor tail protein [Mycobacterium phage SassyB]